MGVVQAKADSAVWRWEKGVQPAGMQAQFLGDTPGLEVGMVGREDEAKGHEIQPKQPNTSPKGSSIC